MIAMSPLGAEEEGAGSGLWPRGQRTTLSAEPESRAFRPFAFTSCFSASGWWAPATTTQPADRGSDSRLSSPNSSGAGAQKGVLVGLSSGPADSVHAHDLSRQGERDRGRAPFLPLLTGVLIPPCPPAPNPSHLPKASPPKTVHLGVRT